MWKHNEIIGRQTSDFVITLKGTATHFQLAVFATDKESLTVIKL